MLDLSNLSNEVKILLILAIAISIGYANNRYNTNNNAKNAVLAVTLVAAGYLVYCCVNDSQESFEGNTNPSPSDNMFSEDEVNSENNGMDYSNLLNNNVEGNNNAENDNENQNVSGSYGIEHDETYKQVNNNVDTNQIPNECYPKDILSPKELLPKDTESTWAQSVPAGQGSLGDQNFLNAGFHIGINTVGQTLRNPNYGLRSEPPNPQVKVSPWMQTTIEPDTNRRAMEIA